MYKTTLFHYIVINNKIQTALKQKNLISLRMIAVETNNAVWGRSTFFINV